MLISIFYFGNCQIPVLGRSTQGVTLMRTNDGKVVSIETVESEEN